MEPIRNPTKKPWNRLRTRLIEAMEPIKKAGGKTEPEAGGKTEPNVRMGKDRDLRVHGSLLVMATMPFDRNVGRTTMDKWQASQRSIRSGGAGSAHFPASDGSPR